MDVIFRGVVIIMLSVTRSNRDILVVTCDSCQARISRGAYYFETEFIVKFLTSIIGLAPDKMVIPKGFILLGYSKKVTAIVVNTCHT